MVPLKDQRILTFAETTGFVAEFWSEYQATSASASPKVASASPQFLLIGIGGLGASGKTSLAATLSAAQVISTDSFWNGSVFDLERLDREVISVLRNGGQPQFESIDWTSKKSLGVRTVDLSGVIVIEGVCALHQMFGDAFDLRIWVDAPTDTRLNRAVKRDGESARVQWLNVWMPNEQAYLLRDNPIPTAHVIVDNS